MSCEVCHQMTNEERMLVCDGCELGYHMDCLIPPLRTIPRGQWLCQRCIADREQGNFEHICEICLHISNQIDMVICSSCNHAFHKNCLHPPLTRVSRSSWLCNACRPSTSTIQDNLNDFIIENNPDSSISGDDEDSGEGTLSDEEITTDEDKNEVSELSDGEILNDDELHDEPTTSQNIIVYIFFIFNNFQSLNSLRKNRKLNKKRGKNKKSRKSLKKKTSKRKKRKVKNFKKTTMENHIADTCGIDLKKSNRFKIVKVPKECQSIYSGAASLNKLNIMGTGWIPPPDE